MLSFGWIEDVVSIFTNDLVEQIKPFDGQAMAFLFISSAEITEIEDIKSKTSYCLAEIKSYHNTLITCPESMSTKRFLGL